MNKKVLKKCIENAKKAGFKHIRYNRKKDCITFNDEYYNYKYDSILIYRYSPIWGMWEPVTSKLAEKFPCPYD